MKKHFIEFDAHEAIFFKTLLENFASMRSRDLTLLEYCLVLEKAEKWLGRLVFVKRFNRFMLLASEVVLLRKLLLSFCAENEAELNIIRLMLIRVDRVYNHIKPNYCENTHKTIPSAANHVGGSEGNGRYLKRPAFVEG